MSIVSYNSIIILHGCPPTEEMLTPHEKRWMNWLADQLYAKGYNAIAFLKLKTIKEKIYMILNFLQMGHISQMR